MNLLETIGATALAGVILGSAAASMANALRIMREQNLLANRLELARSRLEADIGAPCSEIVACAPELRCTLEREIVAAPTATDPTFLIRLHSDVGARESERARVRLSTLTRGTGTCR
jgi:hypothetical protein